MGYDPTPEQAAAIEAFCARGENTVIEAGAGTGKTSTLKFLGAGVPIDQSRGMPAQGTYMAYNRSIADEAAREFPPNVICKTGHGHSMTQMEDWQRRRCARGGPRQTSRDIAQLLGINGPERVSAQVVLSPTQIASAAGQMIDRFARSGHTTPEASDAPQRNRIDTPEDRFNFARILLPWARKMWADLMNPEGRLKWNPDTARKVFQLEGRRMPGHFLFLDEAQDSNGVTVAIVKHQMEAYGMRVVVVGDECQAINGWMGASNAMGKFGGTRLQLTKSFRFGPAIAEEANKWLTLLDSSLRITGHDPVGSTVGPKPGTTPDAILVRKNATAVVEAMRLSEKGIRVALNKTVATEVKRLAEAAIQLRERNWTSHDELSAFKSWGEVQMWVDEDHTGSDLKVFVDLVDRHTPETIIAAVDRLTDEYAAQTTITTAHRSKGLEWGHVRIAGDFERPAPDKHGVQPDPSREDLMLAYVAVTRAKTHLELGGLTWVNEILARHTAPSLDPWAALAPVQAVKRAAWDPADGFIVTKPAVADVEKEVRDMNTALGFSPDGRHLRSVS